MIDSSKTYTLCELLESYDLYNFEFKYYGNNNKGNVELYMKTDINKVSVFSSVLPMTKNEYLNFKEEDIKKLEFNFKMEVLDVKLDIVAIVLRTSDVMIPSAKYTLETLDKLTQKQDREDKKGEKSKKNGICYFIVDHNTGCNLYDGVYLFDKNNKGLIEDLKVKYEEEENQLLKNNLKLILEYYENLKNVG